MSKRFAKVRRLGRYTLEEEIGAGAMGAVFRAREPGGHYVAVKIIDPDLAANQEFVTRFLREINTLAELKHPNLVQYVDADTDGDTIGYAMEFVEGESLGDMLDRGMNFAEGRIVEIGIQLASVLEYAHREHLVHRDIKPDNIIIDAETRDVKLLDLGLARETHSALKKLTRGMKAVGTVDYMSPEQARGREDLDIRCDIYGMGATLYHLLCGKPPHQGVNDVDTMQLIVQEEAPHISDQCDISRELAYIIDKMLRNNRDKRYQKPSEVHRDLSDLLEGSFTMPESFSRDRKQFKRIKRKATSYIMLIIIWGVIAVMALGLLFMLGQGGE